MQISSALRSSTFFANFSVRQLLLIIANISTGACGIIAQDMLADIAGNILGESQKMYAETIAYFLLFMGIGGYVQKFVPDRYLVRVFWIVELMLCLATAYSAIGITSFYAYYPEITIFLVRLWVSVIGLLVGFEVPVIMRINEQFKSGLKENVASVNLWDFAGSFIGGMLWIHFMHGVLHLTKAGSITALFSFTVATLCYFSFSRWRSGFSLVILIGTFFVYAALATNYSKGIDWEMTLIRKMYDNPIILHKQSRFQKLVVTKDPQNGDVELFINGNKQFSSSDEHIYHEFLVHPVMQLVPSCEHVLILGGGDGMAMREVRRFPGVQSIELVDLDPSMTDWFRNNDTLAQLNNYSLRDARVIRSLANYQSSTPRSIYQTIDNPKSGRDTTVFAGMVDVINADAKSFLEKTSRRLYDVIIIDLPDPNCVEIARLYSLEMYLAARNRLAPDGIMVVQSTSPFHAKEAYWNIERTLRETGMHTLPYHQNVPSFGDWGWVMASRNPINYQKVWDESVPTKHITRELFVASTVFGKDIRVSNAKISTVLNPTLLYDYVEAGWRVE